jgi:selenocysteine lyase/cysteine desulfurase
MPVSQFEIILDKNDIKGRSGLQCSPLAHKHIGTIKSSGTYRFSVSYFNSDEDFKNLNKVLRIMYKI